MITRNHDDEFFDFDKESEKVEVVTEDGAKNDTGTYDYATRQAMPLTEQSLSDFDDLFQRCGNLAYAFVVDGHINTVRPNVMAGLALLDAAQTQQSYFSPSRTELLRSKLRNRVPTTSVAALIDERVEEMLRREIDFVLVWHMPGENAVHIETSPVLADGGWDVYLTGFLSEELQDVLGIF